jgi:hypothetical protein
MIQNYAALLPVKRAAPVKSALRNADVRTAPRARSIADVRREMAGDDVVASWRAVHGRVSD